MSLSVDADCAFTYWMSNGARKGTHKRRSCESLQERIESGNLPDWAYAPDGRVHVAAASRSEYVKRKRLLCWANKVPLPRESFVVSEEGVPIVSPECCFMRLSARISFPELIKAGMFLCGRFEFDPDGCLTGRHELLTTSNKLASYVSKLDNINGIKQSRKALRFLVDNGASPPEIETCILLCLPVMYGGYGCPLPELNGHVKLRPDIARGLGYEDCYCDLLWRDAKCVVEYTSEQFHTGYMKQARDEMRRTALEAMGYQVILLTKPQLFNQLAFDGVARLVLRALKKRKPAFTPEFQSKQYDLRSKVLYSPSWIFQRLGRLGQ